MTESRTIKRPRRANCALGICGSESCAQDRATVAARCAHCGEPIGFGTPFVDVTPVGADLFAPSVFKHAACVLPERSQFT